jgi:hypothetical protein
MTIPYVVLRLKKIHEELEQLLNEHDLADATPAVEYAADHVRDAIEELGGEGEEG